MRLPVPHAVLAFVGAALQAAMAMLQRPRPGDVRRILVGIGIGLFDPSSPGRQLTTRTAVTSAAQNPLRSEASRSSAVERCEPTRSAGQ